MVCGTDFSFFDIILLQYYSINTLLNSFYSRRRIITSFFGTAAIYKCSAARLNVAIVFLRWEKCLALKLVLLFNLTRRKPLYNMCMLCALVWLRLVSRSFKLENVLVLF